MTEEIDLENVVNFDGMNTALAVIIMAVILLCHDMFRVMI